MENQELEQKFINYIKEYCYKGRDAETYHAEADKALILFLTALGYNRIVEEWEKVEKWYA